MRIYRQRERRADGDAPTKGKRFRPVLIGPGLVQTLRDLRARREEHGIDDGGWVFLCPPVKRGRYAKRERVVNVVLDTPGSALEPFTRRSEARST